MDEQNRAEEVEWHCDDCGAYFEAPDSDVEQECPECGSLDTSKAEEE